MKVHYFNTDFATKYSVEIAILISNFDFWLAKNKANQKHFYDNKFWTYNSARAFVELFPYFSQHQIRRYLEKMINLGILEKGNYNKVTYDHTLWYTFTDAFCENNKSNLQFCQNDLANLPNGIDEIAKPIPDIKQIINNKEEPPKKITKKTDPKKFYSQQKEISKGEPISDKYEYFIKFMFGENDLNEPLVNILKIENQISFEQFYKLFIKAGNISQQINKNIKISDILMQIENTPKYYKGKKSLYLTVNNWLNMADKYTK